MCVSARLSCLSAHMDSARTNGASRHTSPQSLRHEQAARIAASQRGAEEALQLQELSVPQTVRSSTSPSFSANSRLPCARQGWRCLLSWHPCNAAQLDSEQKLHLHSLRQHQNPALHVCRYCECFASGRYCDSCNCVNCCNNHEHETTRQAAVEGILERNPNAFRPKIQASVSISNAHSHLRFCPLRRARSCSSPVLRRQPTVAPRAMLC